MAVFERSFRRYQGTVTSQTWRFLVIPHYVFKDIFKSKLLVFFYATCFIFPLYVSVQIYVSNNLSILEAFGATEIQNALTVNEVTFQRLLYVQGFLSFFLTVIIGPGLVSRDLANNGLPLYLSRPISRAEYVIGKLSVLFILLSGITWLPGLMLYGLQSTLDEGDWLSRHLRVALGMIVGSWVWILFLGLLALALSAWVKWRPLAAFLMFMIFGVGSFFAVIVNLLFFSGARSRDWGYLFDPGRLIAIVWSGLLGTRPPDGPPVFMAWIGLAAMAAFLLFVLNRKLRAYEVVT